MNVAVNIISSICFILLTAMVVYVIVNFAIKKSRRERIEFIRSFKRGKCLAVILIAIPLFCIGYIDKGLGIVDSILSAISQLIDIVVLKFGVDKIQGLLDKNLFYRITVYYCCLLVIINAILFAISLFSQGVSHFFKLESFSISKKNKTYVLGYNKNNINICKSNSDKERKCVIVDKLTKQESLELYIDKINYIAIDDAKFVVDKIIKQLKKQNYKSKINVVINTGNDEKNLEICRLFSGILKEETRLINENKTEYNKFLFDKISVYFFCDPRYEAISNQIVESSYGCIHYVNKYQLIAMNFIEKYPFASFMTKEHIDYEKALVKENVDINVCMLGFGDTNRHIFLTSVANNQFVTKSDSNPDGVELKQVNYHIFDKEPVRNNKNLNHSYNRYRNECLENMKKKEFLPLPQLPANENFHVLDVNDIAFYNQIKEAFENESKDNKEIKKNKINVNFAIIAYGTDLENIDMAHKLVEKREEWGLENLVIFVKAKKSYTDDSIFNGKDVILIGNEKDDVYNLEKITGDIIYRMARMRDLVYRLESAVKEKGEGFEVTQDFVKQMEEEVNKKWFIKMTQWERDSSLYGCLSLKSKLNLMGLDYCRETDNDLSKMEEQEYLNIYAKDDLPDTSAYNVKVKGKNIINYTLNFPSSKRKNLAILEHLRWNSFMISRGFIPATRTQILTEDRNGKNYALRRHGNLTTFEGLKEFRTMVANKTGKGELDADVIRYDYQILDDAYWLLNENKYKIIRK